MNLCILQKLKMSKLGRLNKCAFRKARKIQPLKDIQRQSFLLSKKNPVKKHHVHSRRLFQNISMTQRTKYIGHFNIGTGEILASKYLPKSVYAGHSINM